MKARYEPKKLLLIDEVNRNIERAGDFVKECEQQYARRIEDGCNDIQHSGCRIVMLSGPSASGKTTTAHRLAREIRSRGDEATVVSLDHFFKNIEEYPLTEQGIPDFEHLHALDVECINRCLAQLIETGRTEIPYYDFQAQRRCDNWQPLEATGCAVVIIEGIHALNPLLAESIPYDRVLRVYAGLRTEYTQGTGRAVATRDLRITRRLVRDFFFRGYSVRDTLELWGRLQEGERRWIKPFKPEADVLLDTSFAYEPGLFLPFLEDICRDPQSGGEYRELLLERLEQYRLFRSVDSATVPLDSMLREFTGGLKLD